ncbi:Type I Iterative PKS [Pyricularia oryzae]|uniref:Type I Iterative PKS n=1 Tax=Pyricularia grisea TaxID=148305 RepID=A0ABQ8N7H8_PYRGI|nr:Type I Iterative PKS [Pyricularia oryzae]KAI6292543.1 Type I Iterative PKS [Pyricularia grisea]KAI6317762.1 Type I Iterative PKS [Pyricularia oryzae]KAI6345360.1 Type I Iterative PKS [Pyricularia oryzae]KAI6354330.1 Type I Iterative PKS [Pyricularia oryzae]
MAPSAVLPESPPAAESYWSRLKNAVTGSSTGPPLPELSSSHAASGSSAPDHADPPRQQQQQQQQQHTPIAIVGMACRMPGAVSSPAEFWELLARCRSGFGPIPAATRFDPAAFQHPVPGRGGCFTPAGGSFLQCDVRAFDAPFFGLTEKEAVALDPQQRLLLECTFEALENAGMPRHAVVGRDVGVFVGGSFPEYESHLFRDSDAIPVHQATGCAYAMQSNRISHFFDLRGPSFTSDTACSSSMVAVHLACQSLRAGDSSVALVGGCHLNMLPEFWISFSTSRLLSDTGRSIAFDNRGTGFGRGEGCAMMVLKPLDQAVRDKDAIRAVIVGTGINQDGRTPGITTPNGAAQEALMQQVYRKFGLSRRECGFVEAHGTGTRVGDPIEARAIYNALGRGRARRDPLLIGSVKSNIGHLEGASGMAGLLKAVLMMERGFVLPNCDFKEPNPSIRWREWNLRVPTMQTPFPPDKKYISVNNFGFGGTNGHVVIQAAPYAAKEELANNLPEKQHRMFVFTANDRESLAAVMQGVVVYLERRPEVFEGALMRNLAYTLGQRRSLLQWRAAIHSRHSLELIDGLNDKRAVVRRESEAVRLGFVFTGQGAQWWAMGRELYEQYPVFTASIDLADGSLADLGATWSLVDELAKDEETTRVGEAHISQPACTAIQLALVDLLRGWGVHPTAVAGHSSGEIAAAYSAGIITFKSAMAIAYHRGRLIPILKERFPALQGRMMAVGGSKSDVQGMIDGLCEKQVRIACFNSPSSLTISGDEPALAELEKVVEAKQMFHRRLVVDVAYHSHHMDLVAQEYEAALAHLPDPSRSTGVKFYSSLYGRLAEGSELRASYWVENLTCPVRFSEAVENMLEPSETSKTGVTALVELGPHSALQGPIKQILKAVGGAATAVTYDSALVRKKDAVDTLMDLGVSLFTKGVNLDFEAVNFPKPDKEPTLLTDLPNYPWNHRTRYWQESRMTTRHKQRPHPRSDLLGVEAIYSTDAEPTWRNILRIDDVPWLRQHKVQGLVVYPFAAFVVTALEAVAQRAASQSRQVDSLEVRDVAIVKPLVVGDADVEIITALRSTQEGGEVLAGSWNRFRISSYSPDAGWTEHCVGLVSARAKEINEVDGDREVAAREEELQSIMDSMESPGTSIVQTGSMYSKMVKAGVDFGPLFQGLQDCRASETHSSANIPIPDVAKEMPQGVLASPIIHPCLLESLIGMYWPIVTSGDATVKTVYLPSSLGKMSITTDAIGICKEPDHSLLAYCHANSPSGLSRPLKVNAFATNSINPKRALIAIEDLVVSPIVDSGAEAAADVPRELCYKIQWEPVSDLADPVAFHTDNSAAINGQGIPSRFSSLSVAVVHDKSELQNSLASTLSVDIKTLTGNTPDVCSLEDLEPDGKTLIVLCELDRPMLSQLSEAKFNLLRNALTKAKGCLWVVRGAYASSSNPEANMISGLSRTLRSETAIKFATLDLDGDDEISADHATAVVLQVFERVFGVGSTPTSELEFTERGGRLLTPRVVNDEDMNAYVHSETCSSVLENSLFTTSDRPLRLAITAPSSTESLHFVDDIVNGTLDDDNVEIEVKAIGMNSRDIMAVKGQTDDEAGYEISGTVIAVGASCRDVEVGDHVCALVRGGYASRVRTKEMTVMRVPKTISFDEVACLPLAYCTAYYGLFDLGRLEKGESVMIHGAASPVGQAAICLAQEHGAKMFATVSTSQEKELLMKEYGISEHQIFSSTISGLGSKIRAATCGRGVDVVLDSSAGDAVTEAWECLAKFGRLVNLSSRDSSRGARWDMAERSKNLSYASVDIFALAEEKPSVIRRVLAKLRMLLESGAIRPPGPIHEFSISNLEGAFKALQTGQLLGKIAVVANTGDQVKATRSRRASNLLRPDATYVLVGGTGGLGRSMARWMVTNGARHIALVSRSGIVSDKIAELIDEGIQAGAEIAVRRCNVAIEADVKSFISDGLRGMPTVRGIVHGTMVLRDVLFENMTWEDYTTVIQGKVQGAWNLHHALRDTPLDFFVALSSAAGMVGNRGQAAYAAANCFLTALVQHRLARGLPASALDLTMVTDSGYLAENEEKLAEVARNLGGDGIREREVLALLRAAISGRLAETCNNHTVTGMRITPAVQPFWTLDAKFKHLRLAMEAQLEQTNPSAGTGGVVSFGAALKAAKTAEEAEGVVCAGLVGKISAVLMLEAEDMDVTRSLTHYHLDSLVAIEIRNFIAREFEASMQVMELLASGSILSLAKMVCGKSKLVSV